MSEETGVDLHAWGKVSAGVPAPPHPLKETPKPFVPTFERAMWHGINGTSGPLNDAYFATQETADYLMKRYRGLAVLAVPFLADGGPFRAEPKQLYIRFLSPGRRYADVNAGWLADFFRAFPEDESIGLADRYAPDDRGRLRAGRRPS